MFILIWIRKVYKVLSADSSPQAIAFAFLFGLTLGFIPLWSGLAILLMGSVLIFRVQISTALGAMAIGKLLSLAGISVLFEPLGQMVLEPEPLHGFWTFFLNLPVIAYLDLQRHAVTGGALLGIVLGLALFYPICKLIAGYRKALHEKVSKNKFFRWLTNFWLVKGLRFIFIGTGIKA